MTRVSSNPFTIQVQAAPPGQITGLTFPSNGQSPSAYVAFQFLDVHLNGLPIWGPNGQGTTFIWKVKYRQQTGYYTCFFWGNNGTFYWYPGGSGGGVNSYYGCHPYPTSGDGTGSNHNFEISCGRGVDWVTTRAGGTHPPLKDNATWYTQALRTIRNADGTKKHIFYVKLPSTANADVIEYTVPADQGEVNPPSPSVTFGDAPWNTGNLSGRTLERLSGTLRHIKIFNRALSEADTLAEAANDALVTSQGQANVWWMKINPKPDDLLCDAGTGRNPIWGSSTKATLWTG